MSEVIAIDEANSVDMEAWQELASQWAFTSCRQCRGNAWLSPAGEVFCPTCEERQRRLAQALAMVAEPPVFQALRTALLGGTHLAFPVQAA